jgi:hypothetical protein
MDRLEEREWVYTITSTMRKLWLFAKHRPLLTCPFCEGRGGNSDYWGEWSECYTCWDHWQELDDYGWRWFGGRVPVWKWVQCKVSIWSKVGERTRIRDIIRCKLGLHCWINEDDMEPGLRICRICYESKTVKPASDGEQGEQKGGA